MDFTSLTPQQVRDLATPCKEFEEVRFLLRLEYESRYADELL